MSEGVQLCLLLLSPDSRRKLHVLLGFMHKLANNKELQLEPVVSNRTLVIDKLVIFGFSIFIIVSDSSYK